MKTFKKIISSILLFSIFYSLEKVTFGIIYYFFVDNTNDIKAAIYSSIIGNTTDVYSLTTLTIIIFVLQSIVELVLFSVFTSYIFAYILNREPKIIFPDKIVIRPRTSEGSMNKLYFCVMIGNKSRANIHNAICTVNCIYLKNDKPIQMNSEVTLVQTHPVLTNFYRFSFEVETFPKKMLEDILKQPPLAVEHDRINVSITGNLNTFGNNFRLAKSYKISDIVIAENYTNLKHTVKNPFTGKSLFQKMKWNQIKNIIEIDKSQKQEIKKKLREIANTK